MEGYSLKSRGIAFAMGTGAVAFLLAIATAFDSAEITRSVLGRALIAGIVCGLLCWIAARRGSDVASVAIDRAVDRLSAAVEGDLQSSVPGQVRLGAPSLARAMDALFQRLHATLDGVQRLALFDPVTSLPNRTHFRRTAESMLAELPANASAALFFIDLDRFKAVNDTMGHATGDVLLGMVANRLRGVADRCSSAGDPAPLAARLAGDEFTLFFPGVHGVGAVDRIGEAVLAALSEPFELADQALSIGASIGVALRPEHGSTLHDLMRAADAAMYHAKAQGRGRTERFSETLAAEIAARNRLDSDLRQGVEREQFALVFQPQVCARNGRIVGAEALLRWHHPDGPRMAGAFIGRAEETGLIVEIGEWVVTRVAATISRWARLGIRQRLAVNISQRQIDHATFFRRLREAMVTAGAPASLLELEISETLAMHCSDDVLEAIAELRADGASVAIDDFGTGYTNLPRLRRLPVDRVKLDRSLVEHVADQPAARLIAQAVIGLVHGLNCEAVAEGIESEAQAAVLRVLGCDVLQGYAIAQPMAEDAFLEWARDIQPQRIAG